MNKISLMQVVFGSKTYVAIAAAISSSFFILLSTLDGYLFFSPILAFSVPPSAAANFALSAAIAILLGIVVSMNVYMFKRLQVGSKGMAHWLSGSFIATATAACGCTSLGFAVITTFGGTGILASSLLTNYQIPLKIVSLAILFVAYYSVHRSMAKACMIRKEDNS